ncbi:hypothetical protein Tco_0796442 [Tanacetum coccineum]
MDSILEDSVDKNSPNDNLVDTLSEMFTDEHALDYSSPPLWDYDDELFDLETVNDNTYDDPFDSKEEKIKDSKILIYELDPPGSSDFLPFPECDSVFYEDFSEVDVLSSTDNEDKVFNPGILIHENLFEITIRVTPEKNVKKTTNAFLILEDFNPPLYELPFHKEVPGQKNTLAEYMILSGADNRPPMLDKDLYDSWKSRMEIYMQNREHGRMILESLERECKLYDAFDKFTHIKGEILDKYYLRFTQLINDMNIYNMKIEQFQVNTKFLNSLPPEWSFAVPVFSPGDDPIAYLNKAMAFLTTVASSRGDKGKVILVLGIRVMLLVLGEIMQVDRQGLLNSTTVKVKDIWLGNALSLSDQGMHHDCDDISHAKAILMANISNYGFDVISEQFEKLVNVSRAKKLEKYHDPLALVAYTGSTFRNTSSYYVTHPMSVVDYNDEYQQDDVQTNSEDPLAFAMLRAYVQEEVVKGSNAQNETGNVQRTLRTSSLGNISTVQCYNCSGKGHYARNYFLFVDASRMEEIEELSANTCLIARIQPADNTSDAGPSYDSAFISEVVQIVLWIVDSGCSKHMTGDRSLLKISLRNSMGNLSAWKFITFAANTAW